MKNKPLTQILALLLLFVSSDLIVAETRLTSGFSIISFEVTNNTWCFDPIKISVNDSLIFNSDVTLYSYPSCRVTKEGNVMITAQLGNYEKTKITAILNVEYGNEYKLKVRFKNRNNPGTIVKISETTIEDEIAKQSDILNLAVNEERDSARLTNIAAPVPAVGIANDTNTKPKNEGYYSATSKDLIVRTNGDSVFCKITKIDNDKIYFNLIKYDREIPTEISRHQVNEYKTDIVIRKKTELNYKGNLLCLAIDPINFIFSGPSITGELTLQGKGKSFGFGFLSGYRIVRWGWMARDLLWDDMLLSSYTFPLALRIYTNAGDKADGSYIGPYMEFGRLKYGGDREDELIKGFGVEYGFKYIDSSRLTVDMSIILGQLRYGTPGNWIKMFYPAISIKIGITI